MHRTGLALTLTLALVSTLSLENGFAQTLPGGRQYTEISGTGEALYRIAIPPTLDGGGASEAGRTLQAVMSNDLTLIGLFMVLKPAGFLANLTKEGVSIDPQPWANIGAQGVIKARAVLTGGNLSVDFYLYDVGKGTAPVLVKTYRGPTKGARQLAHRFGDDVVKYYTGERGIFTTKIAFTSANPRAKVSNIYVMDYDGNGVYRASNTGPLNVLPAWAPSGALSYTGYLWKNPDLYLVAGSGGRATRISKYPGLNIGAAWSPRGDAIALTLSKDGNAEIYVISPSGQILRRLTNNPAIDTSPTWSPDGGRIAFVSSRGGSPQVYVSSASGGGARRLTFKGSYNQEPSWCPRKETPLVAFTGRDESGHFDIFTVNVESGEVKRLTQGQGSNKSPSWAPNGRLIVFSSSRGGLWIMNSDGLNQHQVYKGGGQTPAWSK
jgi:TolB protein